eukprot:4115372-Amphidinium_carterae.1
MPVAHDDEVGIDCKVAGALREEPSESLRKNPKLPVAQDRCANVATRSGQKFTVVGSLQTLI